MHTLANALGAATRIEPYAYQSGHGILAQCPTTGEAYLSTVARVSSDGRYVSLACAVCDAHRRTHDACDPTEPQWHLYQYRPGEVRT